MNISSTLLPKYYYGQYFIAIGFIIVIFVANIFYLEDLKFYEEKYRRLLTVTATFTYVKPFRWFWYYTCTDCIVIYGLFSPIYFKRYFQDMWKTPWCMDRKGKNENKNAYYHRRYEKALKIFCISSVIWSVSLTVIVFMIQGTRPYGKKEEEYNQSIGSIKPIIWYLHFLALFLYLVFNQLYLLSFNYLLSFSTSSLQRKHKLKRKKLWTILAGLSIFGMIIGVGATFICFQVSGRPISIDNSTENLNVKIKNSSIFADMICFFEYMTVFFLIIGNIEVFVGVSDISLNRLFSGKAFTKNDTRQQLSKQVSFNLINIPVKNLQPVEKFGRRMTDLAKIARTKSAPMNFMVESKSSERFSLLDNDDANDSGEAQLSDCSLNV